MTFYEEMAAVALELLGPGVDTFGEEVTISRRAAGAAGYDKATRRATEAAPTTQTVWGTFDAELTPVSLAGSLTATHERVLMAVPAATGGFEPGQDDRVAGGGGNWQVVETAHVIKQGIALLWICGLKSA